ncbi:Uncharacterised protein [Serratia marcescens]|uniref:Uncharacterized protein n=1 Tax=Serratia marcescens TaxID=615 RepID=A0A379YZ34_SERMA|nr:Uncharacterised protein [Serratia marcescens]
MSRAGKLNQVSASKLNIIAAPNGAIWPMKPRKERPERLHSRIFCGLPIGVSNEPAFTASAWKMIKRPTGSADSFFSVMVSGMTINSATSLVRNDDSSAAENTRNSASRRSLSKRLIILRPTKSK